MNLRNKTLAGTGRDRDSELDRNEVELIIPARNKRWQLVRDAVKNGADVSYVNKHGDSALHTALWCKEVPLDVIRLLIHPKIINSPTVDVKSPLFIAVNQQELPVIRELLRAGADPNFRYRPRCLPNFPSFSPMELFLYRKDVSLDVSFLEELMPSDFSIDMLTLLKKLCLQYLGLGVQPQDVTEFQSVLRFVLLQTHFSYPLQVYIQQIECENGSCFALSNKAGISRDQLFRAEPGRWFAGMYQDTVREYEWHWIVRCLIKFGYTITFLPIIQQDPDAQTQQQKQPQQSNQQQHQVIRDIKAIYSQYKHQEEKEIAKLFDLCSNVVRAHVQRPFSADKFRQLKLPHPVVDHLTREDMVDQVYNEIMEYRKSLDGI